MQIVQAFLSFLGGGGPNWRKEFSDFLREEESSWSLAKGSGQSSAKNTQKPSFAEVVKNPPLSGVNSIPLGHGGLEVRPVRSHDSTLRKSIFRIIMFPNTAAFDRILSNQRGTPVRVQPGSGPNQTQCSRCLATSHSRNSCRNTIKCLVCHGWGHVAAACLSSLNSKGKAPMESQSSLITRPAQSY